MAKTQQGLVGEWLTNSAFNCFTLTTWVMGSKQADDSTIKGDTVGLS